MGKRGKKKSRGQKKVEEDMKKMEEDMKKEEEDMKKEEEEMEKEEEEMQEKRARGRKKLRQQRMEEGKNKYLTEMKQKREAALKQVTELEPRGSFVCTSGVLLWGMLENILEAKTHLDDNRYDGQSAHTDQGGTGGGTIYQRGNNFKCRAAKGEWVRYAGTVEDTQFGFYCHTDSLTPAQLVEIGRPFSFDRDPPDPEISKVIFVNRYDWGYMHDSGFGEKWKAHQHVILSDPSWSLTMPTKPGEVECLLDSEDPEDEGKECPCEDCAGPDSEEEETHGWPEEELLLNKLSAKFDKGDKAFLLKDANDQTCGILCEEPRKNEQVFARLIFNDDKELIGLGYQDWDDFLYQTEDYMKMTAKMLAEGDVETYLSLSNVNSRWISPNGTRCTRDYTDVMRFGDCVFVPEPQGSFVCTSGVLLWGTLDNVLEAKTKLDDKKYDGQSTPSIDNMPSDDDYEDDDFGEYNFKCKAAKGQWIRYTTTVDGGRNRKDQRSFFGEDKDNCRIGLFCHADSMTPQQLMELGCQVNNWWLDKVTKNHYGLLWEPHDESISKVVLTDPSWSMTVPEYHPECLLHLDKEKWLEDHEAPAEKEDCSCEFCTYCCDEHCCKECEGTGRNDEKFLVDKLKAKFDKGDRAFMLKDANDQVCGIMCEEPKEMGEMCSEEPEKDGVCARLIFNRNKELIGMKYQEMDMEMGYY